MDNEKKAKVINTIWEASKGLFIYIVYGVVTFPAALLIRNRNIEKKYVQGFWNEELYCISSFLFSLIFFFSLVSLFTLSDNKYRNDFAKKGSSQMSIFAKCKFIFTSSSFWYELLTVFTLIILFPYITPFSEFLYAFFGQYELSFLQENLVIVFSMLPLMFALIFISKLSTINWWQRLILKKKIKSEYVGAFKLIFRLTYTSTAYLLAAATLCIVVPMIYTLWSVAKYVAVGFSLFIVLSLIIYWITVYGGAILSRRRMMKKIKKLCEEYRYKISNISDMYKTVIFSTNKSNFTVSTEKDIYECKLISYVGKKRSLYFSENGEAFYDRDFFGIIKHTISYNYFFNEKQRIGIETKKIIIIIPEVTKIFATDGVTDRQIYSGDSVMGYKVYQLSAFIGSMERRCL